MTAPERLETGRSQTPVEGAAPMGLYWARPAGDGPFPGLLVFQEAFGVNGHIRDVTGRFARDGFLAVAPDLYHRQAPGFEGSYSDREPALALARGLAPEAIAADVRAAHAWLAGQPQADGAALAAAGFCLGGRVAALAAAAVPLKAAVSYYGGGILPLLERAGRVNAPLLLIWGGRDPHIPPEQIRQLEDGLRDAGRPYASAVFSDADHGFNCDARPSFHPAAARQAWALALEFLRRPL